MKNKEAPVKDNEFYCPNCRFPCGKKVIMRTSAELKEKFNIDIPVDESMKNVKFCRLCKKPVVIGGC